jgi:hypothetical protein
MRCDFVVGVKVFSVNAKIRPIVFHWGFNRISVSAAHDYKTCILTQLP